MKRVLIGLGNPDRGDDAAGLEVAGRVVSLQSHQRAGASYELMDLWAGGDEVIIVDAMQSGAPAGTVRRFDALRDSLPQQTPATSHAIGAAGAIELARALGRLPNRITVYGIETASVEKGAAISAPVREAIDRLVEEIDDA